MKIGFGKVDITPRIGVELYGYSGYLNRYATAVRDQLFARSVSFYDGEKTAVIVSCDLVFITKELTTEVRRRVQEEMGIDGNYIMLHATHTHSGPCLRVDYRNTHDSPYMDMLIRRVARSCIQAIKSMKEAEIRHAVVPCEGMGTNRVYDKFEYNDAAWENDFRPEKPELTDTLCHVFKVIADNEFIGFISYFGCHNVVGGPGSTYLHGDYAGIATSLLERENPGTTGLFLQGAEGDVNSALCCLGNDRVLEGLDVMSSRYARAVREGLKVTQPVESDTISMMRCQVSFSRLQVPIEKLRETLACEDAVLDNPNLTDADQDFRWATLRTRSLRSIIDRVECGESLANSVEVQGIRIGAIAFLGGPCEIFQAIKNDVVAQAKNPIPIVMSLVNDEQGYAVDKTTALDETSYAGRTAPLWKHTLPYANIHEELVDALLEIDGELFSSG